jgi:hypothetical protein
MAEQERDEQGRFAGGGETGRKSDRELVVEAASDMSDRANAASADANRGEPTVEGHRRAMQLHHMAANTHRTAAQLSDGADKEKHDKLADEHARASDSHEGSIVALGPAKAKEWKKERSKARMKSWAKKKLA